MRIESKRAQYLEGLYSDSELCRSIHNQMLEVGLRHMSTSSHEAALLQGLIEGFKIEKVLEVGAFLGYSAAKMCEVLPEERGRLVTVEKDEKRFTQVQQNLKTFGDKAQVLKGDFSLIKNEVEAHGPFDLIFMDAQKSQYLEACHWAYDNLKVGGLFLADNAFLFGHVYEDDEAQNSVSVSAKKAMSEMNRELSQSDKWSSLFIPTHEGLHVGIKK